MKKLNKKGFTLIELLAVIAILAILVVIAVPGVLNMYNSSRQSAVHTQARSIVKAAEEQYISDTTSPNVSTKDYYCNGKKGTANPLSASVGKTIYYVHINTTTGRVDKLTMIMDNYYYKAVTAETVQSIDVPSTSTFDNKTINCGDGAIDTVTP